MFKPIVDEFNRFVDEKPTAQMAAPLSAAPLSAIDVNQQFLRAVERRDAQTAATLFSAHQMQPDDMVPAMGLCIAARQGDADTVQLLLGKGVSADCRLMGKTPADWAEAAGHAAIVKILGGTQNPRTAQTNVHVLAQRAR